MGKLKIHSENILPIIKKWLYSDRDIFVRELVSNACDAIGKLKYLDIEVDPRIDITIEGKKLIFSDNGIGMSGDEVEKYIAQLAFSGAEEFVEKYEAKEEIIGHFGLGFYSAYMVAETVEIDTKSYTDAPAAHWICDGSSEYTLAEGSREERGTTITLHANVDEYLEESRIREILLHYCRFLPYPIFLNGTQINKADPLYLKSPSDCTDDDYREFYRQLYPMEAEPHFWIHLNVDVPFNLKGILYFPKLRRDIELNKNTVKLFCNRVFVADSCKDLLPDYLAVMQGAIDGPDIPLNVSRSALQMDRTVRQVGQHIAKKVADRLTSLDREELEKCWNDVQLIVKLGAMQDEKFYERVKPCLIFKTLKDEWTTLDGREGDILYVEEGHRPPMLKLYEDQEIFQVQPMIDSHFMSFLESKNPNIRFKRVDADVDGEIQESDLPALVKKHLDLSDIEVEAKSLSSDALPLLLLLDEQGRRLRDTFRNEQFPTKRTLVVNTRSPLIQAIEKMEDSDLAADLLRQTYDLTLLGQRELSTKDLGDFINRQTTLLQRLVNLNN